MTSPTRKGFSLIEVLVAVAVVGIGIPSALSAFAKALDAVRAAEEKIGVTQALEAEAVTLRCKARFGEEGMIPGSFGGSWVSPPGAVWRAQVTEQESSAGLGEMVLEAQWTRSGRTRLVRLTTQVTIQKAKE